LVASRLTGRITADRTLQQQNVLWYSTSNMVTNEWY
jgi:hypothetical protein